MPLPAQFLHLFARKLVVGYFGFLQPDDLGVVFLDDGLKLMKTDECR